MIDGGQSLKGQPPTRTFVLGDIHGAYRGLRQCFERSGFDSQKDRLIVLGDVCDGWSEVKECIDLLLTIRYLEYVLGNHDEWALRWAEEGFQDRDWLSQGGSGTLRSYDHKPMPTSHTQFLKKAPRFLVLEKRLFVHAGYDPRKTMVEQTVEDLLWDRRFLARAIEQHTVNPKFRFGEYDEIYVGHTPTTLLQNTIPQQFCNVLMLDTGAGWQGKLTIMDVQSKEYWQSDLIPQLYPFEQGRGVPSQRRPFPPEHESPSSERKSP